MIFDEIVQNEPRHGDRSLVGLCTCSGEQMEKNSKDLCFLQRSSAAACSWNTLGSSAQHSGSIWLQWGSKFIKVKLGIAFPWMDVSLRLCLLKDLSLNACHSGHVPLLYLMLQMECGHLNQACAKGGGGGAGRGAYAPPRFWQIRRRCLASLPPRFLDFGTCL